MANELEGVLDVTFSGDINTTENNPVRFHDATGRLRPEADLGPELGGVDPEHRPGHEDDQAQGHDDLPDIELTLAVRGDHEIVGRGVLARGLDVLVDHLMPGRTAELRPSTRKELNATSLLSLPIETFSIKTRNGPPSDAASDLDEKVWAGVVPLALQAGEPEDAPDLLPGILAREYY